MSLIKGLFLLLCFVTSTIQSKAAINIDNESLLNLMLQRDNFFNLIENSDQLIRQKFKESLEKNGSEVSEMLKDNGNLRYNLMDLIGKKYEWIFEEILKAFPFPLPDTIPENLKDETILRLLATLTPILAVGDEKCSDASWTFLYSRVWFKKN